MKESCKSMIYGTFLFLTFQSCTHFAPVFKHPSATCTHILAELTSKGFCKRLSFLLLSSSRVDKLKTSMGFQLATLSFTVFWRFKRGFINRIFHTHHTFALDFAIKLEVHTNYYRLSNQLVSRVVFRFANVKKELSCENIYKIIWFIK